MSISEVENWYLSQPEPYKSCYLALKDIILANDSEIKIGWKYKLPFFLYKGKMFCYLWKDKKTKEPYIGIANAYLIDHPILEAGDRTRIKIIRIDPTVDIPLKEIYEVLELAKPIYNKK